MRQSISGLEESFEVYGSHQIRRFSSFLVWNWSHAQFHSQQLKPPKRRRRSSSGGREVATGVSGEKDKMRDRRPVKI
jgi:hypothetical protein